MHKRARGIPTERESKKLRPDSDQESWILVHRGPNRKRARRPAGAEERPNIRPKPRSHSDDRFTVLADAEDDEPVRKAVDPGAYSEQETFQRRGTWQTSRL